jgi:hypothetical protein
MVGHRARGSSVSEVAAGLLSPLANLLHLESPKSSPRMGGSSSAAALLKEDPDEEAERKRVELRIGGMTVSRVGS